MKQLAETKSITAEQVVPISLSGSTNMGGLDGIFNDDIHPILPKPLPPPPLFFSLLKMKILHFQIHWIPAFSFSLINGEDVCPNKRAQATRLVSTSTDHSWGSSNEPSRNEPR